MEANRRARERGVDLGGRPAYPSARMSELPKPGDVIGVRYRIESLLGQGGMGAVFAALNQATGRAVAIKWMLPESARSQESLARFLAEARSTARIEHPNVIQILDVGQDGDAPFLVMERLRGESLAERLRRGRLTPRETLDAIIPSCKGVHEAHAEGIIHRDLKPDNIFLCQGKDGSPRPPKVLDFGISKLYDDDPTVGAGSNPMTRTGIAMGTPWYMSPEQLNAQIAPDERFDVYAMGVVLYECLTGRPPYNAEGLFELVQQIAAGNPTPIRVLAPEVPADLEAVVARAMHADRNVRYVSMRELTADLEAVRSRIASGAPAPYAPPTAPHGATPAPPSPVTQPATYASPGTPPPGFGGPTPHVGAPTTGPLGGGHWTPSPPAYGSPPSGATTGPGVAPASGGSSGISGIVIGAAAAVLALIVLGVIGVAVALFVIPSGDSGGGMSGGGGGGFGGGGGLPSLGQSDNPRAPTIDLTFSGACTVSFGGRTMVMTQPGTLSVTSVTGTTLTGSLALGLDNAGRGTHTLSTQDRIDTQTLVNVMTGQTVWTNMTMDMLAIQNGRLPDPISGTITINEWDPELGRADLQFNQVNLESTRDGSICTVNGHLVTRGSTMGM